MSVFFWFYQLMNVPVFAYLIEMVNRQPLNRSPCMFMSDSYCLHWQCVCLFLFHFLTIFMVVLGNIITKKKQKNNKYTNNKYDCIHFCSSFHFFYSHSFVEYVKCLSNRIMIDKTPYVISTKTVMFFFLFVFYYRLTSFVVVVIIKFIRNHIAFIFHLILWWKY